MSRPLSTLGDSALNKDHQQQQPLPAQRKKERKKERASALCKTPPSLIKIKGKEFYRGLCLGEGGFARCFQLKDDEGQIYAAKTVAKASITTEKTRTKLLSEISIHKGISHPNVVQFIDCFEDDTNVYILMEMCSNQSLVDVLRRRKRLMESETKILAAQIIAAVSHMHSRRVLHRDLKLGNVFLDEHLNIKIGDFGLATVLSSSSERRKSVCGTPNYIAPEVLYGRDKGHSFEADVWSIGVIIFTLLCGNPPFQSKDIDVIYKRIKNNDYKFPDHIASLTKEAKSLISGLLTTDPAQRLTLQEALAHPFFHKDFPPSLDPLSLVSEPVKVQFSPATSRKNFEWCMARSKVKTNFSTHGSKGSTPAELFQIRRKGGAAQNTVKPQSPEVVLPSSLSPASTKEKYKMVMIKNGRPQSSSSSASSSTSSTASASAQRPLSLRANINSVHGAATNVATTTMRGGKPPLKDDDALIATDIRRTRPPVDLLRTSSVPTLQRSSQDKENFAAPAIRQSTENTEQSAEKNKPSSSLLLNDTQGASQSQKSSRLLTVHTSSLKIGSCTRAAAEIISQAIIKQPRLMTPTPQTAALCVSKWVDFSHKYGLSYELCDQSVGVLFTNGQTLISTVDPLQFHLIDTSVSHPDNFKWSTCQVSATDADYAVAKKIKILNQFHEYMSLNLTSPNVKYNDQNDKRGPVVFLLKYKRHDECSAFYLSNGTVQMSFSDHYKVIVSQSGEHLDLIDPDRHVYSWLTIETACALRVFQWNSLQVRAKLEQCKQVLSRCPITN